MDEFDEVFSRGKVYMVPEAFEASFNLTKKYEGEKRTKKETERSDNSGRKEMKSEPPGASQEASPRQSQRKKRSDIKDKPRFVLSEKKDVTSRVQADDAEFLALTLIKRSLEDCMASDDLPAFIHHNVNLSLDAGKKSHQNDLHEKDAIVVHRRLGVLVVEVKALTNLRGYSRIHKAVEQTCHGKEVILKKIEDLINSDTAEAVGTVIILPNLKEEDAEAIKQRERFRDKVDIICGSSPEAYQSWIEKRTQEMTGGAFRGSSLAEMDSSFKECCMRLESTATTSCLGQGVKKLADATTKWVLTSTQLEIQHSKAEVVHISGPPGTGKSLHLIDRAKQWLKRGRTVFLLTGQDHQRLLRRHLEKEMTEKKKKTHQTAKQTKQNNNPSVESSPASKMDPVAKALSDDDAEASGGLVKETDTDPTRRSGEKFKAFDLQITLLENCEKRSPDDPVSVILDEICDPEISYRSLLELQRSGKIQGLWTACNDEFPETLAKEIESLGGKNFQLQQCLRCPWGVVQLANLLRSSKMPEMTTVPDYRPVRVVDLEPKIVCHAKHNESSFHMCSQCKGELRDFFLGLGLSFAGNKVVNAESKKPRVSLTYSDAIAIVTDGSPLNLTKVAEKLREMGLPAVRESTMPIHGETVPEDVNFQMFEEECIARMEHTLSGKALYRTEDIHKPDASPVIWVKPSDAEPTNPHFQSIYTEKQVLHVVSCDEFCGLERPLVLVVHEGDCNDTEAEFYRQRLFEAVTRCQGHILLLVTKPSTVLDSNFMIYERTHSSP